MKDEEKFKISKHLSYVLRHKPEASNLTMDKQGWVEVEQLLSNIPFKITREDLDSIVESNDKKRFSYSEDRTKIKAAQGHSNILGVKIEMKKVVPPFILYHGTADKNIDSIRKSGLVKGSRDYVHLSSNTETAIKVGSRHGKPVIFEVNARAMHADGFEFYQSDNGVFQTDRVPSKYLCRNENNQ